MRLTKMDKAKVVATALYNLPELVTEKNTVAWRYAKKLTRSPMGNVDRLYELGKKVLEDRNGTN